MPEEPNATDTNGQQKRAPASRGGKPALAEVTLLDGNVLNVPVERKAKGEKIFDEVCTHLDLLEKDYFGLSYRDKADRRTWLDLDKRVGKVLKGDQWKLDFEVKFYPKDPSQLQEDFTRYLLCLQVRNDILSGKLPCSFVTHAMLGSYLVQSQLGDYSAEEYPDASYLSGFKFCPEPAPGLEERVMELHKGHKGQTPAEAELHYLENAKILSMYGVDIHPAKDSEGVDIQLGVCSTGILVYQGLLRINRFAWPKILKISYRRNNFYIKIRPGEFEQYEQTVGFKLDNSRAAKNLWKVCVDQHTFFRLMSSDATKRPAHLFPRIGSLYRWNRKTQVEVLASINARNSQNFERSHSCRPSRSMDALAQPQKETALDDNVKRHTMSHAPARPLSGSPARANHGSPARIEKGEEVSIASISSTEGDFSTGKSEDQKPAGGVAVLPMEPFKKKKSDKDREKDTNGTNGLQTNDLEDDEKENRSNRIEDASTPNKDDGTEKKKQSPSHGLISIFGSHKKTPKDQDSLEKQKDPKSKKEKDSKSGKKEKIAVAEETEDHKKSSGFAGFGKIGKSKDRDEGKDKKAKDKSNKDKSKEDDERSNKDDSNLSNESPKSSKKGDKLSVFKTDKKKKDKDSKKDKKDKSGAGGTLDSSRSTDGSKSPDSSIDRSKTEKDRSLNEAENSPYTRVYEYTAEEESNKPKSVSGFSYESDKTSPSKDHSEKSPVSPARKETGVAFNYAPGEINKNKVEDGATASTGGKKIFSLFGKKSDAEKQKKDHDKDSSKSNKLDSPKSTKSDGTLDSKSGKHDDSTLDRKSTNIDSPKSDRLSEVSSASIDTPTSTDKKDKKSKKDDKSKTKDSSKSKDKDADKSKSKDKDGGKSKSKDKDGDKSKSKDKDGDKSKSKDKDGDKSKSKDKDGDKSISKDKDSDKSKLNDSDKSKDSEKSSKSKDADKSTLLNSDLSPISKTDLYQSKKDSDLYKKGKNMDFLEAERHASELDETRTGPKIVKTTTKKSITNTGGTITQNVEEKVEDFDTGEVTHSTHVNTAEGLDESRTPYISATAVTTRTATTLEDLGTNAKTSQVEEKTVARSTTTTGSRSEQRVVTQEVRATTVVNEPQLKRSDSSSSISSDDSGTPIDGDTGKDYYTMSDRPQGPIVETETVVYSPILEEGGVTTQQNPLVATVSQRLEDGTFAIPGAVVTSSTITSKTRTVETLTYKTEKDGVVETRVEQKITIQSDGDPIDHDKALAEAIQEATAMNPDMRVEKIEIQQEALP